MTKKQHASFDEALLDPCEVYAQPEDVLWDEYLTKGQKEKILDNWAEDEKALSRAENENMPPKTPEHESFLQNISIAKRKLRASVREQEGLRETVCVFNNEKDLNEAVAALEISVFSRQDMSVLGGRGALEKTFGVDSIDPRTVEDSPYTPRTVPVRSEEKALGAVALAGGFAYVGGCIAAVAAKNMSVIPLLLSITMGSLASGAIGAIIVVAMWTAHKKRIQKQIDKGGLVLWVHTPNQKTQRAARSILKKHGGRHIHVHQIL